MAPTPEQSYKEGIAACLRNRVSYIGTVPGHRFGDRSGLNVHGYDDVATYHDLPALQADIF